jgi:hypothetical protein
MQTTVIRILDVPPSRDLSWLMIKKRKSRKRKQKEEKITRNLIDPPWLDAVTTDPFKMVY